MTDQQNVNFSYCNTETIQNTRNNFLLFVMNCHRYIWSIQEVMREYMVAHSGFETQRRVATQKRRMSSEFLKTYEVNFIAMN